MNQNALLRQGLCTVAIGMVAISGSTTDTMSVIFLLLRCGLATAIAADAFVATTDLVARRPASAVAAVTFVRISLGAIVAGSLLFGTAAPLAAGVSLLMIACSTSRATRSHDAAVASVAAAVVARRIVSGERGLGEFAPFTAVQIGVMSGAGLVVAAFAVYTWTLHTARPADDPPMC